MKTGKEDILAEKDAEIQSLNKQIVDMKKVMDRLREEKNHLTDQVKEYSLGEHTGRANEEEILRLRLENERLREDLKKAEIFKHSEEDQRFGDLFKQADQLKREKEELIIENQKLRAASQKINDMNKSLVEELKVREVEIRARPVEEEQKGPAAYESRKGDREEFTLSAPENETRRIAQQPGTSVENQRTSVLENQLFKELQDENQYLREMLKKAIGREEVKGASADVRQLATPYQQTVNFSISSPLQPDQTESSKKIYNLQPASMDLGRQVFLLIPLLIKMHYCCSQPILMPQESRILTKS